MNARRNASIAGLASALALACGPPARPADTVVFASGSDLESANPLVTIHPLSRQVQRHALLVTLTHYDSALRQQPYFARRWQWRDASHRTLTLWLEPTLRWHDGRPTTAKDVAFTISAGRDPQTGFARAADLTAIDSVRVPDDTTVEIRFATSQRDVPAIFAELPIVPEHILASVRRAEMRRAPFNLEPVGNGPFRFVTRTPGQRWIFAANPGFPLSMGGPPKMNQLVIAVVDEPTTKFAGLASGDLDFAGIAPTMASLAERDPAIDVLDYPVLFTTGLVYNTHRPPFADARVRHAIDLSIDRNRIVQAALAGYGTPAAGPVPPENPLALPGTPRRDPRQADSLLDAAGYSRDASGQRKIRIELLTVSSGDNPVEQLLQADLAQRGIRVEIRQLELAAFLTRARAATKDFDVLITGIPGDLSLSYLTAMFASTQRGSSLDYADFHTTRLDDLLDRARVAPTIPALVAAWRDFQMELAREIPVTWLYHSRGVQGVSARMRGVRMDLRGELATVSRWTVTASPSRSLADR